MKFIKSTVLTGVLTFGIASSVNAMDTVLYTKLVNDTIEEVTSGDISNINQLIAVQKQLVKLGVSGSKEYIRRHPEHAGLLGVVVKNAKSMMHMSLEEIEDQWHQGKYLKSQGYNMSELDHFGELFSLMDSIIHPSTSYIALKEYKRTRNSDLLNRAAAELIEVVEHVAHIGKGGEGTQVSSNH